MIGIKLDFQGLINQFYNFFFQNWLVIIYRIMDDEMDSNLEMKCFVDEVWYDGMLFRVKGQIIVYFKDFDEDEESLEMLVLMDFVKLWLWVRVRLI